MIIDVMELLGTNSYTEALLHILVDWEKTRYLEEKERILKLKALRFNLLQHELERKKQ